jgi:hypothetical protein
MDNGFNGFNEAQDELQRLLQEINRIQINTRNRNTNARTRRTNDNTEIITFLREFLYSYNANMREYQDNMRIMLQIAYLLVSNSNTRTNPVNERRNENDLFYYTFLPYVNRINRPATPIHRFDENVIVRPTNEQIDAATSSYDFSANNNENNTNTNCPITLEEFQEGEHVCKIIHCGHTFRRDAITNWFQGNVRCPVCRYDIRDFSANIVPPPQPQNNQSLTDEELQNNLRTRISNSLMSIIDQYYSETDLSQNLTYTFEIPIIYNDISGNYTHLR